MVFMNIFIRMEYQMKPVKTMRLWMGSVNHWESVRLVHQAQLGLDTQHTCGKQFFFSIIACRISEIETSHFCYRQSVTIDAESYDYFIFQPKH